MSHTPLAVALLNRGEYEEAITSGRKAIECQPNDTDAHAWLALILGLSGQPAEGLASIARAIRLNPLFVNGPYINLRSLIQVMNLQCGDAILSHEQNMQRHGPVGPPVLAFAVAAMAALGRMENAQSKTAELQERFPNFHLSGWNFLVLFSHPDDQERLRDLMVAAGIPN